MRFVGVDSSQSITLRPSKWALPRHLIYVSSLGCHLTPAEARRVAKALERFADAAEKREKGAKK